MIEQLAGLYPLKNNDMMNSEGAAHVLAFFLEAL